MGKYIRENGKWFFVFEGKIEKVEDKETLKKLKTVSSNSIGLFDLWNN